MREINRTRYLRGTKSWTYRNVFVFGGVALSLALGVASYVLMPNQVERVRQKGEEEKEENRRRRDKILAIQQRRRDLELASRKMSRSPLKAVQQADDMLPASTNSRKVTPEKTCGATVVTAARLLGSAKKSQTKRFARRMKLSLKKQQSDADDAASNEKSSTSLGHVTVSLLRLDSDLLDQSFEVKGGKVKDKHSSEVKDKTSSEVKDKTSSEVKHKTSSEVKHKTSEVKDRSSLEDFSSHPSHAARKRSKAPSVEDEQKRKSMRCDNDEVFIGDDDNKPTNHKNDLSSLTTRKQRASGRKTCRRSTRQKSTDQSDWSDKQKKIIDIETNESVCDFPTSDPNTVELPTAEHDEAQTQNSSIASNTQTSQNPNGKSCELSIGQLRLGEHTLTIEPNGTQTEQSEHCFPPPKEQEVGGHANKIQLTASTSSEQLRESLNNEQRDHQNAHIPINERQQKLSPVSGEPQPGSGPHEMELSQSVMSTSFHTCPACGESLQRGKLVRHMQTCVESQQAQGGNVGDDDNDGNSPSGSSLTTESSARPGVNEGEQLEKAMKQADDATKTEKEYVFCQLCQKDISHLDSHWRTVHINKCIDQEEKTREEAAELERAIVAARNQTLPCPICGKTLKTEASRKSHVKKCANTNGVSADQLMSAMKRQKEEHLSSLEAGLVPISVRRGGKQPTTAGVRRGQPKLPKSKHDEDLQLAIALSTSLQRPGESIESGATTMAGPAATASRKTRKHKIDETDYLLVKLTREQAASRIESRVADLLAQEGREEEEENIPPLPAVSKEALHVERLKQVHWSADASVCKSKMLWRLSSLEDQPSQPGDDDPLLFYVPTLMPPVQVSKVVAGSKVRRMSQIPGRSRSQRFPAPQDFGAEEKSEYENDEEATIHPPPLTQTAILLAEMAAEADDEDVTTTQMSSGSLGGSSVLEKQCREECLAAFSSLVNKQEFSDVHIKADGNVVLFAHRIVLSARCPALLKMSEKGSGMVDLTDYTADCVLVVLKYLYCGSISVDTEHLAGVLELAHRLNLRPLVEVCSRKLLEASASSLPQCNEETDMDVEEVGRPLPVLSIEQTRCETGKSDDRNGESGDRNGESNRNPEIYSSTAEQFGEIGRNGENYDRNGYRYSKNGTRNLEIHPTTAGQSEVCEEEDEDGGLTPPVLDISTESETQDDEGLELAASPPPLLCNFPAETELQEDDRIEMLSRLCNNSVEKEPRENNRIEVGTARAFSNGAASDLVIIDEENNTDALPVKAQAIANSHQDINGASNRQSTDKNGARLSVSRLSANTVNTNSYPPPLSHNFPELDTETACHESEPPMLISSQTCERNSVEYERTGASPPVLMKCDFSFSNSDDQEENGHKNMQGEGGNGSLRNPASKLGVQNPVLKLGESNLGANTTTVSQVNSSFDNPDDDRILAELEQELSEKVKAVCEIVSKGDGNQQQSEDVRNERRTYEERRQSIETRQHLSAKQMKQILDSSLKPEKAVSSDEKAASSDVPQTERDTEFSSDDDLNLIQLKDSDIENAELNAVSAGGGSKTTHNSSHVGDASKSASRKRAAKSFHPKDSAIEESIEISDDDMFSGDDAHFSLVPDTDHQSSQKLSEENDEGSKKDVQVVIDVDESSFDGNINRDECTSPESDAPTETSVSSRTRSARKHISKTFGMDDSDEDSRHSSVSTSASSDKIPKNQTKNQKPAPFCDFPSFSVSAIEKSSCQPSARSGKGRGSRTGHFKTSTPQPSHYTPKKENRSSTERDERNVFDLYTVKNLEEPPSRIVASKQGVSASSTPARDSEGAVTTVPCSVTLSSVSDNRRMSAQGEVSSKGKGSVKEDTSRTPKADTNRTPKADTNRTPKVDTSRTPSVFDQDSLYVTPADQTKGRRTFQLITPAPESSTEFHTPASRNAASVSSKPSSSKTSSSKTPSSKTPSSKTPSSKTPSSKTSSSKPVSSSSKTPSSKTSSSSKPSSSERNILGKGGEVVCDKITWVPVTHAESVSYRDKSHSDSYRNKSQHALTGYEENYVDPELNSQQEISDTEAEREEENLDVSGRGSADLFAGNDSDSDLEIVATSQGKPPSPKFTTRTSSQPQADGEMSSETQMKKSTSRKNSDEHLSTGQRTSDEIVSNVQRKTSDELKSDTVTRKNSELLSDAKVCSELTSPVMSSSQRKPALISNQPQSLPVPQSSSQPTTAVQWKMNTPIQPRSNPNHSGKADLDRSKTSQRGGAEYTGKTSRSDPLLSTVQFESSDLGDQPGLGRRQLNARDMEENGGEGYSKMLEGGGGYLSRSPRLGGGRLSQRSDDSDKELMRVADLLLSRHSEGDSCLHGLTESDAPALAAASADDDVWEGFDNVDVYNPDLDFVPEAASSPPPPPPLSLSKGQDSSQGHESQGHGQGHESQGQEFQGHLQGTKSDGEHGDCEEDNDVVVLDSQPGQPPAKGQVSSQEEPGSGSLASGISSPEFKTPSQRHRTRTSLSESKEEKKRQKSSSGATSPHQHSTVRETDEKDHSSLHSTPVRFRGSPVHRSSRNGSEKGNSRIEHSGEDHTSFSNDAPDVIDLEVEGRRSPGVDQTRRSFKDNALKVVDLAGHRSPEGFYVNEEDMEAANSSFLWAEENAPTEDVTELSATDSVHCTDNFKSKASGSRTPSATTVQSKKSWEPPSPFTPMPAYGAMATPELKNEVQKYGLKPVGKKRMKLILEDIYHKTHQYETDSDCDNSEDHLPNLGPPVLSKQASLPAATHQPPVLHKQANKSQKQRGREKPPVLEREAADGGGTADGKSKKQPQTKAKKTKRGLARDSDGDKAIPPPALSSSTSSTSSTLKQKKSKPVPPSHQSPVKQRTAVAGGSKFDSPLKSGSEYSSSPEKGSYSSSQDSDVSGIPDVSVLELGGRGATSDDEDPLTASQKTSRSKDVNGDLTQFFQSNRQWHFKVLTYEALDLAVLKDDLKNAGIGCSHEKLLNFLDEKCITFTTKNLVPKKRRRRGKTAKGKKVTASQK